MDWILLAAGIALLALLLALMLRRKFTPKPALASPARRHAIVTDTSAGAMVAKSPEPGTAGPGDAGTLPQALAGFLLAGEDEIATDLYAHIAGQLSCIPMPPRGLHRFMTADIMADNAARELAELVMTEPHLAAKVLARVNSAYYGLQSPITSVPHAITYLGMNTVRSMALSFLVEGAFSSDDPVLSHYYDRVWDSGMFASDLCSLLAAKLRLPDSGALCTQTILSFLGDLAAPALLGGQAAALCRMSLLERLRFEQEKLGASAVLLGTIMMRQWELPAVLVDAVAAAGRVVATPVSQANSGLTVRSALSYACARIGEAIAQRGIERPEQISLLNADTPELYHLQGYLRLPALARLPEYMDAPDVRLVLMRMITAVRNEPA